MLFFVKRFVLFFVFILNISFVLAQSRADRFEEAVLQLDAGQFSSCVGTFQDLLKTDSLNCNLNYKVALSLFNIPGRKTESLSYFEKASKKVTDNYREGSLSEKKSPIESVFYYARVLMVLERLDEAKLAFVKYRNLLDPLDVVAIDYVDQLIHSCDNALVLKKKELKHYTQNLPSPINSSNPLSKAVFNGAEDFIVYVVIQQNKLVFYSSKKVGGVWQPAVDITDQLAVNDQFTLCSISADGNRLYLAKYEGRESALYISTRNDTAWSACVKMSKPVNSNYDQTFASESADGETLFFTSNRKGGIGGLDIYMSKKNDKGQWGSPVNLGKSVNSIYNEETPYLAADNTTLFFSSQGHFNIGGYDVFMSKKMSETSWSEPQNIGYPLNTTDDDLSFIPSNELGRAYFVDVYKNRGSLVEIDTREHREMLYNLMGKVSLADESSSLKNVMVNLINEKGDTLHSQSPSAEGKYLFQITPGSYSLSFTASGYTNQVKPVYAVAESQVADIQVDAVLQPIQVTSGEFVSIRSVFFDFNSAQFARDDSTLLERIARIMKDYNMLSIEVEAHTDNKGDKRYNQRLSQKRANAVSDYLVSRGVEKSRIRSIGVGDAVAIARNTNADGSDNPEGRRFNRRAEIRLLNAGQVRVVNEDVNIPEHLRVVDSNEYSVCLAEKDTASVVDWPTEIDKSLISRFIKGDVAYYVYGTPTTKSDALARMNQINASFPGAYIVPLKYFNIQSVVNDDITLVHYALQVGAFKRKVSGQYFKKLEKVDSREGLFGLTYYTYGNYASMAEAAAHLSEIKKKGFVDAFVVPLTNSLGAVVTGNSVGYTVQFFASFVPVSESKFSPLANIKVSKGNDGYLRYTVGVFDSYKEASNYLRDVKQAGFSNAFVRRIGEISGY